MSEPWSRHDRLHVTGEVHNAWLQRLEDRGIDFYDPATAEEVKRSPEEIPPDDPYQVSSDYDGHYQTYSADGDAWLELTAMLAARGITPEGESV